MQARVEPQTAETMPTIDQGIQNEIRLAGERLLEALEGRGTPAPDPAEPGPLTMRETEVLRLLSEGKSNREVAARLRISVRTVETHRSNIITKLHLHSVAELVRYAMRHRITA